MPRADPSLYGAWFHLGVVQIATLSYGAGNWLLVQGDKTGARAWFERATRTDGWPAFGFILAEVELRRLR